MTAAERVLELAIVGAGPTASSLLERLAANGPGILGDRSLRVHLIDPHRAGTGRVWRADLDPRLWMNSLAEDVTLFTDESVRCEGPIRPGPSLYDWARTVDDDTLTALAPPELAREIRGLDAMSFPTRRVQSVYLDWFQRTVLASMPPSVEVVVHEAPAVDLIDEPGGRQRLVLAGPAGAVTADVVVLALGHLDAAPDAHGHAWAEFADRRGLTYLPPGHTAEIDLSALAPGEDVLVLGFGQAFTDLLVLVTEARGGRFVAGEGEALHYEASGLEPVLYVGSRRGVPYRSKLGYRLQAPLAPLPHVLDDAAEARLAALGRPLEFGPDLWPLVAKEVGWAYYHELFRGHPSRVCTGWDDFAAAYERLAWGPEVDALVARTVPGADDRLDLAALNRPLAGLRFGSQAALHEHVRHHVEADVSRRTNPEFSADLGAFVALLTSFGTLGRLAPHLTPRSRVEDLHGRWFSFFMYYASGPPAPRLRQLLALADAGLVRFLGAGTTVVGDARRGRFGARSTSHPDVVAARTLVEARIASPSLSRTTDALLRHLLGRGEVVEEVVHEGGWSKNTGKLVVGGPALRVLRADGRTHPHRHALGVFTNRPASGAFARPRTNAPAFRQNDAVARAILTALAAMAVPGDVGAVAS